MWWLWVVGGLVVWFLVAAVLAVGLGRGIRLADEREGIAAVPNFVVPDVAAAPVARVRRRAVPLPPVGVALAGLAVALETVGYALRLNGSEGATARLLSMDAVHSLPRMYVAALFAAAALAAVAGAGLLPGRRAWWLGVGLVAAGIAAVKAGSTVHAEAMSALGDAVGNGVAVALSGLLAAVVVAALWFLSRSDRRDRRRVLGVLALYGIAAVGLSALSGLAAGTWGGASSWAAAATYVEESGEALAGVAFLVAVLVGVAPRLVLPAEWALRRAIDLQTLDLPETLPGSSAMGDATGR